MRKVRYRQILRHRIGDSGHIYKYQVRLQQSFWEEDKANAWTIPQVREIHSSLGTWDKGTSWVSCWRPVTRKMSNYLIVWTSSYKLLSIFPKANYKSIKKAKEARLKEQEQRTLDFLEREGC